jgi:pimeloyl-ACP methyl ester carboxylesterase
MRHLIVRLSFIVALLVTTAALPPSPAALAAQPTITWEPCATSQLPTQECAEQAVPLDYDEPDGATITLAVARVPATDQTNRVGSILLNPGGPGNSGVMSLPPQYAALPAAVRERFDVVAFDPRGIGESAPVRCFTSSTEQVAAVAEMPRVPVGPQEVTALQLATAQMIQGCIERNADTLAHLSTANVARDMDRLRQAVGDEALTYLGTSYGTYLGATYAQLFPDTIRAMVLDGVINPPSYTSFDHGDGDIVGPDTTSFARILSPEGSAGALQAFFAECAAAGADRCAFAATDEAETRAKFDALMERLRAEPMVVQGPAGTLTVTYSILVDLMWQTLYSARAWPIMVDGLQRLEEGDAVGFLVATGAIGRPPSSAYLNEPEGRPGSNCLDTDNPHDPALYPEMARRAEERSPYFGALWTYLALPCAFWPAEDADRYTGPWDAKTSATILLISRLHDPATPHGGAVAAAETLANARLLTINGWGHGYYLAGRSTCADDYMAAYVIDLELPPVGTVCPEDVAPFSEPAQDEAGTTTPAATPQARARPTALPILAI